MTETKYTMQFTETELKLLQNALHTVKCNDNKLLNKIQKKVDTINTNKQVEAWMKVQEKEQIKLEEKVEEKVEEFKRDPKSPNSEETDRAWFEYKQILEQNKDLLEGKKTVRKYGTTIYKNEYDWFKSRYSATLKSGKGWLKKLKKVMED